DLLLAPSRDGERIAANAVLCPNDRASNASVWHLCFVHAKDSDMRDFREAKAMARTLRSTLAAKGLKISNSQSLELIAEIFGVADWNTLAAAIRKDEGDSHKGASTQPTSSTESISIPLLSGALMRTRERAVAYATERKHEYATLEHFLLALMDDADAAALMNSCNVDSATLKRHLLSHLDFDLTKLMTDNNGASKPTPAFRRVVQRAGLQVKQKDRSTVTGADALIALFSESKSPAVRFLGEQGVTRQDAVDVLEERRGQDAS
ncbi:MAG: Clp protease N-terminal domain-containing protein, partial [Geminicoccaceae bacterium]